MGETFSQMLLRLINERGMDDPKVTKKRMLTASFFQRYGITKITARKSRPFFLCDSARIIPGRNEGFTVKGRICVFFVQQGGYYCGILYRK